MSEREKNRRALYRKNREKWIFAMSVIAAVLTIAIIISAIVSVQLNKKYYIGYSENGSLDYTVVLKDNEFYANNWVYFARNNYFETVGEGLCNAKIKYLHYRVVGSDKLIQALEAKNIDVGEPNATAVNITAIGKISHLNQKTVTTNGYGYVGINPKYVPDIEVRRAIMMAMDPIHCLNYYTAEYAEIINRSMSSQSWIWNYIDRGNPADDDFYYYPQATTTQEITDLVKEAGWKLNLRVLFDCSYVLALY